MDFNRLSMEVMRSLRGRRTQPSFSRRLGYRSNAAWAWEAGKRWPRASVFLKAASLAGVDVGAQLNAFTKGSFVLRGAEATSAEAVAELLRQLRGGISIRECGRTTGLNRFALARWLHGETEPALPHFLQVVAGTSQRLADFISLFADPSTLPTLAAEWQELLTQRKAAYEAPFSHVLLRALELKAYRQTPAHDDAWLAGRLGIELEHAQEMLEFLARAGNIRYEHDHWVPSRILTVDTGKDPAAGLALRRYWAQLGLERMAQESQDLFAYNLFTVSERELEELRRLYREYFRTLRSIAAASRDAERLVLANVQLLTLDSVDC